MLALGRLRQEDCKLKLSLGYTHARCLARCHLSQTELTAASPQLAVVSFASCEAALSASPSLSHLLPERLCLCVYGRHYLSTRVVGAEFLSPGASQPKFGGNVFICMINSAMTTRNSFCEAQPYPHGGRR